MQALCDALKTALVPKQYGTVIDDPGAASLLLRGKGMFSNKYAFAVFNWVPGDDGPTHLAGVRSELTRVLKASALFGQVGVFILFVGPRDQWAKEADRMPADSTGSNAVIVQGVQFIDPATGERALNHLGYGNAGSVAQAVNEAVDAAGVPAYDGDARDTSARGPGLSESGRRTAAVVGALIGGGGLLACFAAVFLLGAMDHPDFKTDFWGVLGKAFTTLPPKLYAVIVGFTLTFAGLGAGLGAAAAAWLARLRGARTPAGENPGDGRPV